MATVEAFNTGLTEAELTEAFDRALNDYSDSEVDELVAGRATMNQVYGDGNETIGSGEAAITENSDLDDYYLPGVYYAQSGAIAATLTNTPFTEASFKLITQWIAGQDYNTMRGFQMLYPNPTSSTGYGFFFLRHKIKNGWTSWYRFNGTVVTPNA